MSSELEEYLGQKVVVDTKTPYIFIGALEAVGDEFFTLLDVDVHDHSNLPKSKEFYILESLKYGIKANRHRTKLMRKEVISISLLEDVIEF